MVSSVGVSVPSVEFGQIGKNCPKYVQLPIFFHSNQGVWTNRQKLSKICPNTAHHTSLHKNKGIPGRGYPYR